jgi:shikimate kinase
MSSLVLIGYRGSGKTTVGNILAKRLGMTFVDTDAMIAKAAGVTIRDIFACIGQPYFQELERETLEEAMAMARVVVSTGGGIVVRPENRMLLRSAGHPVIYLAAQPELLVERIQSDKDSAANRPALTAMGGGLDEVRHVLEVRDPLYREVASHIMDASQPADEIAGMIIAQLRYPMPPTA